MKSPLHNESSTTLTKNSRAGLEIPLLAAFPNQPPLHHTRLVSSFFDSRDNNVEMMNLLMARWMKTTAMTPRTVRRPFQRSKNHKNSKNATRPTTATKCTEAAIQAPNLEQQPATDGPNATETRNCSKRTHAFNTIGPTATTRIRTRALGGVLPVSSGKAPTNMYATVTMIAMEIGPRISEIRTFCQLARGISGTNRSVP